MLYDESTRLDFIKANLGPISPTESIGVLRGHGTDEQELAAVTREREIQRMLFDAGLAGICFPKEYGGLGLPIAYQKAFDNVSRSYELPIILNTPTFTICAATILDTGSEEQKRQHIAGALRGDEVLVQLLSEPSGGSDLAGVITRADRKGDGSLQVRLQHLRHPRAAGPRRRRSLHGRGRGATGRRQRLLHPLSR